MNSKTFEMEDTIMAKSKQAVDQGFVREEDLRPETEDGKVMPKHEVDRYAKKAESSIGTKGDELQGEGDYESAESYNQAATDFAQKQNDGKERRP
jgi:hypothetical protein